MVALSGITSAVVDWGWWLVDEALLPRAERGLTIAPMLYSIDAMTSEEPWGDVEVEPEVEAWLLTLDDDSFGQARFHIDLLAERGVHLGEPHTRHLLGNSGSFGSTAGASRTSSLRGGGSSC